MSSPKVSVIIPLYNQERYFNKCIRSVCNQTYTNLEIIVVNDGSTDKSPAIANKWKERDGRIRVIDKQNEGSSFARRDGYLASSGEYMVFVDSDDYLPLNAIEILIGHIAKNDLDLVIGSSTKILGFIKKNQLDSIFTFPYYQIIRQPELFGKYYLGFFMNSLFPVNVWGRIYRKAVIDKAFGETELFSEKIPFMGEDQYFNMILFPYINSMYRIRDNVYFYRYGGGTAKFNPKFTHLLSFSDMRLNLLDQYDYQSGYEPLFIEYVNCVYYHAQQLLEYKQADKTGVIDFFKKELAERELMLRMIEFYSSKSIIDDMGLRLILNHDYEGMYNHAYQLMKKRCGSLSYKAKKGLNNFLEFKSKFF